MRHKARNQRSRGQHRKKLDNVQVSAFSNFERAFENIISYWLGNGVDRIGFIGEENTSRKRKIFENVMKKRVGNVNPDFIRISEKRFERGGYDSMKYFYDNKTVPRAVICAYDNMAIGAIRYIKEIGGRVPDDVAVVGMDNIDEADYLCPPLASVEFIYAEMLSFAVDMLMNAIEGKPYKNHALYQSRLVMRESAMIK